MAIDTLIPTSELEAVNAMLAVNGTSPVESLDAPLRADVEMALNFIKSTSRGVQSRGWHFNTVRAELLERDLSGEIPVPDDTLRLRKTVREDQRDFDISHRQGSLWNNLLNEPDFSAAAYDAGVYCDIVHCIDFDAMPESARQLIFIAAGRRYQEQSFGNADLSTYTKADESQALANLIDAEGLIEDVDANKSLKDQKRATEVWDAVSRQVQSIGWHFNFRKQVAIAPIATIITLPTNTLRAFKSNIPAQWNINASHRGTVMYDVQNDTGAWVTANLPDGVLKVDIVVLVARASLPEIAKKYIDIRAARQLQPRKQANSPQPITGYTERDEYLALRDLQDAEGLIEDYSLANAASVSSVLFGRDGLYGTGAFDPTINR